MIYYNIRGDGRMLNKLMKKLNIKSVLVMKLLLLAH